MSVSGRTSPNPLRQRRTPASRSSGYSEIDQDEDQVEFTNPVRMTRLRRDAPGGSYIACAAESQHSRAILGNRTRKYGHACVAHFLRICPPVLQDQPPRSSSVRHLSSVREERDANSCIDLTRFTLENSRRITSSDSITSMCIHHLRRCCSASPGGSLATMVISSSTT